MSAAARRRLAARAAYARGRGLAPRRSARLTGAPMAPPVALADLKRWPAWPAQDAPAQAAMFRLVALVAARDALIRVIDGQALRGFAAEVGEEALEAVMALPAGGGRSLPAPGRLAMQGEMLARAALPATLRDITSDAIADAEAERFVAIAEALYEGAA